MRKKTASPLVCLAASGGGHVRQLLDLEPFWSAHEHFFVTEDTALGRSIGEKEDTEFVPHFALGQAKLGSPAKMLAGAFRSAWRSLRIVLRRRPDFVITTGAGSQIFLVLWARLAGAHIVLIDSFARFDSPSAFARLASPLAHDRFSQSEAAARAWNDAEAINPLKELDTAPPLKEDLVFATVGATLPFPRLSELVLNAKKRGELPEQVVLQIGEGAGIETDLSSQLEDLSIVETLPFEEVQQLLERARIVICHGGTGSILTALRKHCSVIVVPRVFERGEHYDNHQAEIAASFEARGLIFVAHDDQSMAEALSKARTITPQAVTTDYAKLIERLRQIVAEGSAGS
ncbi:beta-1,4-glucuronosyltransferase WelK [Aurantiacibacter poecillastricola]|uniref:beta-1,4-glucuronosyltransferase WelK n=1 Tax=Aurantiacibacter poecillastricola TaxID=3064385 RepID=UPI00273EF73E|nr:glycosyltransferase [Aurantiacibacter sp. 219JJ12-13]MDP5260699.1 glycosyltransferase [Aurantiacibacter sp. 219JJ12-13]